jgi:hypothetical protein
MNTIRDFREFVHPVYGGLQYAGNGYAVTRLVKIHCQKDDTLLRQKPRAVILNPRPVDVFRAAASQHFCNIVTFL